MESSPSILFIDDDPVFRRVISVMFKQEGFSISVGDCVKKGFQMIQDKQFQVAVVDYKLPDLTGVDFFEKTRRTHPNMVRILLTAYTTETVLRDAINRGEVFRYIHKPVHTGLLLSSVEQALTLHEIVTSRTNLLEQLENQNQELKKRNEDLRIAYSQMGEMKALQDQILNILPEPILLISGGERILSCNKSSCNLLGYSRGEFLGKSITDLFRSTDEFRQHIKAMMDDESSRSFETIMRHKDGRTILVSVIMNILKGMESGEELKMALLIKEQ